MSLEAIVHSCCTAEMLRRLKKKKKKRNVLVGAEPCNINKDFMTLFLGISWKYQKIPEQLLLKAIKKVDGMEKKLNGMENTKAAP